MRGDARFTQEPAPNRAGDEATHVSLVRIFRGEVKNKSGSSTTGVDDQLGNCVIATHPVEQCYGGSSTASQKAGRSHQAGLFVCFVETCSSRFDSYRALINHSFMVNQFCPPEL